MYRAEVSSESGYSFTARANGYEFLIDLEQGSGATPPDALLASLAGCVGVYVRKYAQGAGIDINVFSVTAEADMSEDAPRRFKSIRVKIDLKKAGMDERRKRALISFVKNCPVHNTLAANPDIALSVV